MKQIQKQDVEDVAGGTRVRLRDTPPIFDQPQSFHGPGEACETGLGAELIDSVQDSSIDAPLPGVK